MTCQPCRGMLADMSDGRRRAIDNARTSSALEGGRSTDASRADQEAYVRGEIDIDELAAE